MTEQNTKANNKEDEIDLVELFLVMWKRKWSIVLFTSIITILTALHQLYIAVPIYRSDCVILPLSSSGGGSSLMSQLGGLASFVGVSGPKQENTLELILKSRTFHRKIAKNFKLNQNDDGEEGSMLEAMKIVGKALSVAISKKDSSITIAWEDKDPKLAKEVLSFVLLEAKKSMSNYTLKKESSQLNFLRQRVKEAESDLVLVENKIKIFQEANQGVQIEKQAESLILQLNSLKIEQQKNEVQLSVSQRLLSERDSKIKFLDVTVQELQKKIDLIIGKIKKDANQSKATFEERTLVDIPKIGLEYARLYRKLKINEKIYGLLIEQLEIKKIEVQKQIEGFEIIDEPIIPEKRISPRRTTTTLMAMLASFTLILLTTICSHLISNMKRNHKINLELNK
jgi:tyrosine-protein kinase Etk/Wzc